MFKKMPVWKKLIIAVLVLIPLILAFFWMNYLKGAEEAATSVFLSPVDSAPVIIALTVFMSGYVLFLVFMFYDNIREFVDKTVK